MKRLSRLLTLASILAALVFVGCQQNTTTEPSPHPEVTDDGGNGSGGGSGAGDSDSGTSDAEVVNIHFRINYQSNWLVVVQIDNHKDKIASAEWEIFVGDRRLNGSSFIEPTFDISDVPEDRCDIVTVRLNVVTLKEGYALGAQTDRQALDITEANPDGCREPVARFSHVVSCEKRDVDFTNQSTGPEGTTFEWEFGDGAISRSESPSHRYDRDGEFGVILTATSPGKLMGESSAEVRVIGPPDPSFTASCSGLACSFNSDRSSGSIDSFSWDFGDGTFSSSPNPSKTFSSAGTFQVLMSLRNECATRDATESITVAP